MKISAVINYFVFIFIFSSITACRSSSVIQPTPSFVQQILSMTPEADSGIVYGRAVNLATKKPIEANLFLAKNLTIDHPELPPFVSFSYDTDPRAAQDEKGFFVFNNVSPGKYVIVAWTPVSNYFVKDSDLNSLLLVKVEAGQIINLGELKIP